MLEMKKDYIKLIKKLQELGNEILDQWDGEEEDAFVEEVETMDIHLECCLKILKKAME